MPDPFQEDPALVHCVDPAPVPGTHLLVIGIGSYDHLKGGSGALAKHHLNMRQLESPPISARKIATWFIERFDCTESPLASVSMVLSEPQPARYTNPKTGMARAVPSGTMQEVEAAMRAWMARAESDPRNRILLYFCGHGLSEGPQNFYLMRDYGADKWNPLDAALNYLNFITALASCKPSYQFLLFDACRSADPLAALNLNGGRNIFAADPTGRLEIAETMQQCPIFSTELDRQALGRAGEESLCARAFLRAMNGACCSKEDDDQWYVTTDRIVEALTAFQNLALVKSEMKQRADANAHAKIRLRRLAAEPRIPVFISLDDASLAASTRITAMQGTLPPQCISDPQSAGWASAEMWETELAMGRYKFTAEHVDAAANLQPIEREEPVIPLCTKVTLKVSKWAT